MMNQLKSGLFALAIAGFMVSCQNDSDVRDAAAQSLTGDAAAQGLQPGAPGMENNVAPTETATVPTGPTTTIQFAETEFDFGTVDQGEAVTHVYKFKNTGNEPLIISSAKGSCGCTVPKWPNEPVPPGKEGEMLVEFDTKGKSGMQNKKVTITANTNPQQTFIYIKGNINAPASATPAQ
ncbi:MAG: DUF1573 domain-containing protein [Saprospiraceae bacterium]